MTGVKFDGSHRPFLPLAALAALESPSPCIQVVGDANDSYLVWNGKPIAVVVCRPLEKEGLFHKPTSVHSHLRNYNPQARYYQLRKNSTQPLLHAQLPMLFRNLLLLVSLMTSASSLALSGSEDWERKLDTVTDFASLFEGQTPLLDLNSPEYKDVIDQIRRNPNATSIISETAVSEELDLESNNRLSKRESWKCETSDASPLAEDVLVMSEALLRENNRHCIQHNPGGSNCHKIVEYQNARVGICGRFKVGLRCLQLALFAKSMVENCKDPVTQKVGGYYEFKGRWGLIDLEGAKMIVYSSVSD